MLIDELALIIAVVPGDVGKVGAGDYGLNARGAPRPFPCEIAILSEGVGVGTPQHFAEEHPRE